MSLVAYILHRSKTLKLGLEVADLQIEMRQF